MQKEISIIIVNYNSAEYLSACLTSIFMGNKEATLEVIVVDNNSTDNSVSFVKKYYPSVILISNDENVGFASANNQAILKATGKYILLLNPDTFLPPNCLEELIIFLEENPNIGLLSPKLIRPDGTLDWACRRNFPTPLDIYIHAFWLDKLFPSSRFLNHYSIANIDSNLSIDVEAVAGAFMLVRKKALKEVGLLDQRFFMYFEDLDWSYRFIQSGWRVFYYAQIEVLHHKRGSTKKFVRTMIREFYISLYQGYEKYYGENHSSLFNWLMKQTLLFRMNLSLFKETVIRFLSAEKSIKDFTQELRKLTDYSTLFK